MTVAHAFQRPGSYPVTLTVTNAVGLADSLTEFVTIGDEAPIAIASALNHHPVAGQWLGFDGATSRDRDGRIVSYDWIFGDGKSSGSSRPSHKFASPGRYTVTLTVTGSGGERATTTVSVHVYAPAHITRVQVGQGAGGPTLVVNVNGPGRLRMGSAQHPHAGQGRHPRAPAAEPSATARARRPSDGPRCAPRSTSPRWSGRRAAGR